jgi:protein-S-isoprenylcysteine O-methyltransferase Ste14
VRVAWTFVAVQFVLLGLLVLLPFGNDWVRPTWLVVVLVTAILVGLAVMGVGGTSLGRGLSAAPLPNAHAELRTGGLYRFVRHPIYSGLLLVGAAIAAVSGSLLRLGVFVLLVLLINAKARWEEVQLARRFPGYAAYAARTPRFVPLARRRGSAQPPL